MPKIVRFHGVGDASVLKLEGLPKPEPKGGRVLLKVEAGKGFALAFDPVAGPGWETLAKGAGQTGTIIEYGALDPEPTAYPLFAALSKGLTIRGFTLFEIVFDPEHFAPVKKFVADRLASGAFKPLINKTLKLDEIVGAHRYMESNEQIGKIAVSV
jgi:NADPH:quinone reductase-like Zn-dependent oxidoreductase